MTGRVFYRENPKGQTEVLRSRNGPVGKHMMRLGNLTQRYAKQDAGKKTGNLSRSIKVQLTSVSTGLLVRVGSDSPIALLHHEGTRRHVILPRNASVLVFTVGGRLVFAKRVNHPGTRANPFLQRGMALAIGRAH